MWFGFFCGCDFINVIHCAREVKIYNQYENGLLANSRLPNVEFRQKEMYTEDHRGDSSQVVLAAARKISAPKELYASHRRKEFASSVQL